MLFELMNDKIDAIATGGVGSLLLAAAEPAVQAAAAVPPSDSEITTIGQVVIQIAIGIATLWRLIRKKKD